MKAIDLYKGWAAIHKRYNVLRNGKDFPLFKDEWDEACKWRDLYFKKLTQGENYAKSQITQ